MKKLGIYALAAIVTALAAGCSKGASGSSDSTVAVVNGEPITMDDYTKYLQRKQTVTVITDRNTGASADLPVAGTIAFQGLRDMVNRRILLQIAKDEGVYPSDADIKTEIDFQISKNPNFLRNLLNVGMTLDEVKKDVTMDLAREKILTKGIVVTKAEAEKYVADHPDLVTSPPQAQLQYIVVSSPAAKKQVDSDILSGKSFGAVAAAYSVAPNARQNNGAFATTNVSQMSPALQKLVEQTPEQRATDWKEEIDSQTGNKNFVKFFIQRKVAAKKNTLNAAQIETVRRSLALQRGAQGSDLPKRLQQKLKDAKIDITMKSLQTPWDEAFKKLKSLVNDQPTGTSTMPSAGTAGTTGAVAPATPPTSAPAPASTAGAPATGG